ncbi:MAG: rhomboid family intramembrane serine protease [Calditrichaeota bacterium]|nr:MAG: rhomboid family intramembrane serine protease [Calditrichota bacterium]
MRFSYNAPFVLTFSLIAVVIMGISQITGGVSTKVFFTIYPKMPYNEPLTYLRYITYAFGHANWEHLRNNLTFLLLLGPMLEEKYGSKPILLMSFITVLITGILNSVLFNTALLGASGIVFMFILLASFSNARSGSIPLTFLLVLFLFLGHEVINARKVNSISEFAHIVGGICGSIFGFWQSKKLSKSRR